MEQRGSSGNCSRTEPDVPLSSQFFSAIQDELWLFLIPAGLALVCLAVFLEEVGFFLRHSSSLRRTRLSLWILGLYPVFAVTSLIGLYVPRSSSFCNFIASLYHSFTLLKFMGLITDFFGGQARMLSVLSGQQVSPDPFPCCCCCCLPMVAVSSSSRSWMMAAVLQLSVVRSVLFFVTLVLWTDGQYNYGDVDSVHPNLYVNAVTGVSTLLSFYGHLLFYRAARRPLLAFGLRAKFLCVVLVLVLCGLQSAVLEALAALDVFPCSPPFSVLTRSQLIYHYSIIVEMFCIGLYARHTFRRVEPSQLVEVERVERVERVEQPVCELRMGKAVQTDVQVLEEDGAAWSPGCSGDRGDGAAWSPGCSGDRGDGAAWSPGCSGDRGDGAAWSPGCSGDRGDGAAWSPGCSGDRGDGAAWSPGYSGDRGDGAAWSPGYSGDRGDGAAWSPGCSGDRGDGAAWSPGCSGDRGDGADGLCRIERRPLDGFLFPQVKGHASRDHPAAEEQRHHQINADVEQQDFSNVTVV